MLLTVTLLLGLAAFVLAIAHAMGTKALCGQACSSWPSWNCYGRSRWDAKRT